MISVKLQLLAQMVRSMAEGHEPIDGILVADAIEGMIPAVRAMEDEPIPERQRKEAFKVIIGGRPK